jgi:hypothetical protein
VQADAADGVPAPQSLADDPQRLRQAGAEHVVVEIGVAGGGEGEGDAVPFDILVADVARPAARFAVVAAQAVEDLADRLDDLPPDLILVGRPVGEGVHIAHLIGDVIFVVEHPGLVAAGHNFVKKLSLHLAEEFPEKGRAVLVGVGDGVQALPLQFGIAPPADAPYLVQGQVEEVLGGIVRVENHCQSVGFAAPGGEFGIGLAGRHAHGRYQSEFTVDRPLHLFHKIFDAGPRVFLQKADIHEVLIHRVFFHVGGKIPHDLLELPADPLVFVVVDMHEDEVGADPVRIESAHGGLNAQPARLVAGGGHDAARGAIGFAPAAHGQRQPVEVVRPLFDLCIETIHVEVERQVSAHTSPLMLFCHCAVERDAVYILL